MFLIIYLKLVKAVYFINYYKSLELCEEISDFLNTGNDKRN